MTNNRIPNVLKVKSLIIEVNMRVYINLVFVCSCNGSRI